MTFILKNPKSLGTTMLYFKKGRGENHLKVSTKISISPKNWDNKKQRIKPKNGSDTAKLNLYLESFNNAYLEALNLKGNNPKVKSRLLELFKIKMGWKQEVQSIRYNQFLTEYVERYGSGFTYEYKRRIGNTVSRLREFESHIGVFEFEDIDLSLYTQLLHYFRTIKMYNESTIRSHVKAWKSILFKAKDIGLPVMVDLKKFKIPTSKSYQVYLTIEELMKIKNLDLSTSIRLLRARDIFLVACSVGLRYSDLSKLSIEGVTLIEGQKVIRVHTSKTMKMVTVVITPFIYETLLKYGGSLPLISNQKLNLYIKEICELAEVKDVISFYSIKGGKKLYHSVPKFELIKTHTARRTFITLLYLKGYNCRDIMVLSGHSSVTQVERYIKADETSSLKMMIGNDIGSGLF